MNKTNKQRKSLYLIIAMGFLLATSGFVINEGGAVHIILGCVLAAGAILALIGLAIDLYRSFRQGGL